MTEPEWRAEGVLAAEALDEIDLKELSNAKLEHLADSVQAEIDRRWRKREKEAAKDAMKLDRDLAIEELARHLTAEDKPCMPRPL